MVKFAPMALYRAGPLQPARLPAADRIALDRSPSGRTYDAQAGHLEIRDNVLSCAGVSDYYGYEIPQFEALGLDPNTIYPLLRPADELARAASSWDGKPLLSRHKPMTADDHDPDLVVGAVSNVRFVSPYLRGTLTVWDAKAIEAIQDGTQRDLSCGYFYQCILRAGFFGNTAYSGIMAGVQGNHVTLTANGRIPGAFVGDSAPPPARVQAAPMFLSAADSAAASWRHQTAAAHRVDMARRYPGIATLKNLRP